MGILEAVIMALIYIALLALAVYLIIWVLSVIGLQIPEKVVQILWVIVILIAILILVRVFLPSLSKLAVGLLPLLV